MHNSKPNRPGSRTHKPAVIDTALYVYKKYSPDFAVQPGDKVQYMDEDGAVLAGTVLPDGAYCLNNINYVRVEFADGIDAVAVNNLIALPPLFDYSALTSESRIVVMQKTSEIKTLIRRSVQDIIDIGTKLIEVKDQLGHGEFGKWLSAEFNWNERTARRFMSVADAFKTDTVSDLKIGAKALYLLAAPSTPDEAREEALEIAKSGETITYTTAKAIVAQHKPAEPPRQPPPLPPVPAAPPARVFAPVPSSPVRYSTPQDDYVEEFPAVQVESPEEDWQSEAADAIDEVLSEQVERANEKERARRAASKEQSELRLMMKSEIPQTWSIDDSWRVLDGDLIEAAEGIADESVDIIITDPPYSRQYLNLYTKLSMLAARVLKPGGSVICMTGQICLPEIMAEMGRHLNYHWTLTYLTQGGQSPQIWPRKINTFWKPLLWYVKGEYTGDWMGDVVKSPAIGDGKAFHEWGQSVNGFLDIVNRFTYPNQLILDPFMGAGTTGLAALQTYRRFIGIDIDTAAVQTAAKRLSEFRNEATNG